MSGPEQNSNADTMSDEAIRRCLLGNADLAERTRFEELVLFDEEMERRVRQAELELADDYSGGQLSDQELKLFERNFLVTKERGKQLAVSRALQTNLSSRPAEPAGKDRLRYPFPWSFQINRPLATPALVFLALILSVGLAVILLKRPRSQTLVVATRQQPQAPGRKNSPEYAHPPGLQPSQSAQVDVPTPAWVGNLTLQPGAQSVEQTLRVPASPLESDIVRVTLLLGPDASELFRGELLTTEGQHVTDVTELRTVAEGQQKKVVWDLPARLLRAGDYQIKLTATSKGQTAQPNQYTFRVQ